jgi:transcriptional regulator with XRE-family HTH domain
MEIGLRLKELREERNMSQGDIEARAGLLRCYISRVENGHTVPSIETLEKMARALDVPMYRLFHNGAEPPKKLTPVVKSNTDEGWGSKGKDAKLFRQLHTALSKISDNDRAVLLHMTRKMAKR